MHTLYITQLEVRLIEITIHNINLRVSHILQATCG